MEVFWTIISGVTVFVLSQLCLKIFINPVVAFREVLGEISHLFLYNQAKITNANGGDELRGEVKRSSALLLAKKEAIPCFNIVSKVFGLPRKEKIIESSQALNIVSYNVGNHSEEYNRRTDKVGEVIKAMNTIETHLDIVVKYSGKSEKIKN